MVCREYKSEDYGTIFAWWQLRGRPVVPEKLLGPTGVMVEDERQKYCAGFLHETHSSFATIDSISSNPNTDKEDRSKALDLLIIELTSLAIHRGYKMITAASNHPKLMERYRKLGFTGYDEGVTIFGRDLTCLGLQRR